MALDRAFLKIMLNPGPCQVKTRWETALVAGNGHFGDLDGRTGDGTEEFEVVPDHFDALEDRAEVPGDRDLGDGVSDLAVLDPQAEGSPRDVSGNGVEPVAQGPGEQKAFLDRADDLFGGARPGRQREIVRADPSAVGVSGRLEPELSGGVDVAQEVPGDPLFHD